MHTFYQNIKNVQGVHYSLHLDEQFTVVFMTKSFCSNAIEVRKVYTNIACNFRDGP